jgi:hypothetical protein
MRSKISKLFLLSFSFDFDVIVFTETWLNNSISDAEILCADYVIYRLDRSSANSIKSDGGGVLIAIKRCYESSLISSLDLDVEFIAVKCVVNGCKHVVTCSYIPPSSDSDIYEKHAVLIDEIVCSSDVMTKMFVYGDFNLSSLDWIENPDDSSFMLPINSSDMCFADLMAALFLHQINSVGNINKKFLDLVFTNVPEDASVCVAVDGDMPFHSSQHHESLLCILSINNNETTHSVKSTIRRRDFKSSDFELMINLLEQIDWSCIHFDNLETSTVTFYNIMNNIFDVCVPIKSMKCGHSAPPWMTQNLRSKRNAKDRAFKKFKRTGLNSDYVIYSAIRKDFNQLVQSSYSEYLCRVKTDLRSNPKSFWDFIKTKKGCDIFPNVMSYKDFSSNDKETICEYFRDFFQNVYVLPNSESATYSSTAKDIVDVPFLCFSTKDILAHIRILKPSWSPGPDGIPSVVIKRIMYQICKPLCLLFNMSLSQSDFPSLWKTSYITPLFKSGQRNYVSNYRGICKLSCIPKMFEALLTDYIYFYCQNIISIYQHGFVRGRSTATNLIEFTSKVVRGFEHGMQTDVIYTDFSKAFDRVNHKLLLLKLHYLGFPIWLVKWISAYLDGRTQYVVFKDCLSSVIYVTSGVPQGSHIGPLLFILFINDLCDYISSSSVLLYADDCKIFNSSKDI